MSLELAHTLEAGKPHTTWHTTPAALPKVLLVGGPDVDLRLDLMQRLRDHFELGALGTLPTLHARFAEAGFAYHPYILHRRVHPLLDLYSIGQLVALFRRLKPQVVHTFDAKPSVWGRLAARLAGVPVIVGTLAGLGALYARDDRSSRLTRRIYEPLQKVASHFSELTIFQNQADLQRFTRAGIVTAEKALVIPGSGVASEVFAPAKVSEAARQQLRSELGLAPDSLVVTMVARLIHAKGVCEFAAAAQRLASRFPKARFLLVGPLDEASEDRLSPAELRDLQQHVLWPGPRRDIPTVLAISSMFVLPSTFPEGIPRVLMEAASMGLPIITTDSPGCNDVVEAGVNGLFVPARDSEALSTAIGQLLEQPALRQQFGQVARQRVCQRFDLGIIAQQTRTMYTQLLAAKGVLPTAAT